jgi:hypothetical protein
MTAGGTPLSGVNVTAEGVLRVMLQTRVPSLSQSSSSAVDALVLARGSFADANTFARRLGLHDRHELAYVLRRDGLCSLRVLASWIKVACWLAESELGNVSLCRAALNGAQDPGSRYRLVKRITGIEWSQVQARGLTWLLEELVLRCTRPLDHFATRRHRAI